MLFVSSSLYTLFFFFSSRRRHTRSLCDWSSDVCSSDLPVLCAMAAESLQDQENPPALIGALREGRAEAETLSGALAQAHANGVTVDWEAFFKATAPKAVSLPTYPFQRQRYWLSSSGAAGDANSIGQADADHPLLAAVLEHPDGEGLLLTGRISLQTHPWLADHAVAGTVLLPGSAFVELALKAAEQAGAETLAELTLQAPLILSEQGATQLQVSVSEPDQEGARELAIHSRPQSTGDEEPQWTCHAQGVLSSQAPELPESLGSWPPEGAEPIETEFLYDRLAEAGFDYGPAFQGATAAWRQGETIHAEVALPDSQHEAAGRYAIHPALLDAALHTIAISAQGAGQAEQLRLPFAWQGVSLFAAGAGELRVRLSVIGEGESRLDLFDLSGGPIARIDSLTTRPIDPAQLHTARPSDDLLAIEWQKASPQGEATEKATLHELSCQDAEGQAPTLAALQTIQAWLTDKDQDERLAIVSQGAVATSEGESPDPALAAAWGLIRSAQAEHPGRFTLIDTDGSDASKEALEALLATDSEPQLALREGVALAPRAGRLAKATEDEQASFALDPDKTVLISGATGGLGSLIARHLVTEHGARHLLLLSRSGKKAKGAKELGAELKELGAKVKLVACDIADKEQLKELLKAIPKTHPLGAIIHTAGVLDDATIEALDQEHLETVFAPKADAAQHLHELSKELDLDAFVTFSSAAAVLGSPGQGNYAAANAYLDALDQKRQAEGLAATSIAWGLWQRSSAMTSRLSEADIARMGRGGITALTNERGLALFDQALSTTHPDSLAVELDRGALRTLATAGLLPALLSGLIRVPKRRSAQGSSLAKALAEAPEAEREAIVMELVRKEVAAVLGHGSPEAIEPEKAFKELGFDSLAAVELRNRLTAATGVRLAATAVFDYPNADSLATFLLAQTSAAGPARSVAVRAQATDEPIAILGMACRFPGAVSSPRQLWQLLAEGKDAIAGFPEDRGWDLEGLYDPDPEQPGTSYVREGGFVADAAEF